MRRQVRSHLPVHGLDLVRSRREEVLHQAARDRAERHDERVDADIDRPLDAVGCDAPVLAHAEDDVGGHLPAPEDLDRPLPGREPTFEERQKKFREVMASLGNKCGRKVDVERINQIIAGEI